MIFSSSSSSYLLLYLIQKAHQLFVKDLDKDITACLCCRFFFCVSAINVYTEDERKQYNTNIDDKISGEREKNQSCNDTITSHSIE